MSFSKIIILNIFLKYINCKSYLVTNTDYIHYYLALSSRFSIIYKVIFGCNSFVKLFKNIKYFTNSVLKNLLLYFHFGLN